MMEFTLPQSDHDPSQPAAKDGQARRALRVVLFLLNPIEYAGGSEKSFSQLAGALAQDGHAVTVAGTSHVYRSVRTVVTTILSVLGGRGLPSRQSLTVERDLRGANVMRVGVAEMLPGTTARARFQATLRDADVIYCKNEWLDVAGLRWFLPPSLMGKVVIGVHTAFEVDESAARTLWGRVRRVLYDGTFYRRQLERSGAVHTLNHEDATLVSEHYGAHLADKTASIPLPLVTSEAPRSTRVSAGSRLPLKLLFAQRLTHQKGLDYFAALIHSLSDSPDFQSLHFTIAGSGDRNYEEIAAELARRYANVDYLGFVADMSQLYATHDLVVIPSRWETFSHVAIEAEAAGLPVIASDIPGPNSIVEHDRTGWLLPPGDTEKWRDVISEIVVQHRSSASFLEEMGRAAQLSVRTRFGGEALIQQQVALLSRVAGAPEAGNAPAAPKPGPDPA